MKFRKEKKREILISVFFAAHSSNLQRISVIIVTVTPSSDRERNRAKRKRRRKGFANLLSSIETKKKKTKKKEGERERDGEYVLLILWMRSAIKRCNRREMGSVLQGGSAWFPLFQSLGRRIPRRSPLH